ncbi:MAG TPA: hypothetical protein VK806_03045 [Bacteroidia bacterium]|jgi:hypothetical protein|nr:hypothetical protein [Bacteroidia bacterium]
MKKYLFATLSGIALVNLAFAQTGNMQIAYIDKTVKEIKRNISNYQNVDSANGRDGYRSVYTKNEELKYIIMNVNDHGINKHVEWYFSEGKEIYAEVKWTDSTGAITDNEKSYFSDWHLINWVKTDGEIVDTASWEFKNMEPQLIAYGKKLENFYSKTETKEISNVYVNAKEALERYDMIYSQNVKTRVVYHIEDGMLNGRYLSYYKNGKKVAEGNYEYNNRVGDWKVWDSTGKLCIERTYKNNYEYKSILPKPLADTPRYTPRRNADGFYVYSKLTEKMIKYSQRTWSYVFDQDNPLFGTDNRLFKLIYSEIKRQHLIAYQFYYRDLDNTFSHPIDSAKIPLGSIDYKVIGFITKGDWFYDSSRAMLDYRTLGICPIALLKHHIKDSAKEVYLKRNAFEYDCDTVGLFWVYYPQIRPYLAKEKVKNDSVPRRVENLDDVFFFNYYNSSIFMKSAVAPQWGRVYDTWNVRVRDIELEHQAWLYFCNK